jgi:hypothetical protein
MLKFSALAVAASLLLVGLPLPAAAQVKVKVTSTGDVGQYAGMCGVPPGGTDVLQGLLEIDNLDSDGSARYKGVLVRETKVMACGLKPSPTEDQPTWCTASLDGSAKMAVTLEIAYPQDGIMSGLGFDDVPSGRLTAGNTCGTPELSLEVLP